MADDNIIHELLKEVRQDQKEAYKASFDHREETIRWHEQTNARLDEYNRQLDIHIEGVKTLKNLHQDNIARIESLEEPVKTMVTIKKWVIGLGGIAGALVAIAKFIGLF